MLPSGQAALVGLHLRHVRTPAYTGLAGKAIISRQMNCRGADRAATEGTPRMADSFADQLRAELDGIQKELDRLSTKRRLIDELLNQDSGSEGVPPAAGPPSRRASRCSAPTAKRSRLPRGLTAGKIPEFLGRQREPVHATQILAYLEQHEAAPRSAEPMATLQSSLQRMKEQGEIENTGRNHWRLRAAESVPVAPAPASVPAQTSTPTLIPEPAAAGPPVITSTTTFGSRLGAGQ